MDRQPSAAHLRSGAPATQEPCAGGSRRLVPATLVSGSGHRPFRDPRNSEEWEAPYGHNANTAVALMTRRYMHETGTTEKQLASVAVALRAWGVLNPNAMFRKAANRRGGRGGGVRSDAAAAEGQ